MKDFSVTMPVRNNIKGLKITLGAFELFTHQKDKLEVFLIVDNDDDDLPIYKAMAAACSYDVKIFIVPRSENFSRDYHNYAAAKSSGKNVMVYNDDCYMQTDGWDDIIRKKTEGKSFYLVDVMDSTHEHGGMSFPRFPIISRKAINAVGFFFYPQLRMWPSDRVIHGLYNYLGLVIPCHEVKMQHDHVYEVDESKARMWRIYQEDISAGILPVRIQPEIDKLRKAMKDEETRHNETDSGRWDQSTGVTSGDPVTKDSTQHTL